MKRKYKISTGKETIEREYNYIPVRYSRSESNA